MLSFFRNNTVAIHVTIVLGAFAWLYGGLRGSILPPVMPWLVALLFEAMICFPQRREGESTYEARERVWKSLRKDPLVWVTSLFLFLLVIPFGNHALCPLCDVALLKEGFSAAAPVGFLPYCVNRIHHLTVFLWFLPSLVAMVAVRHALTRDGKRLLIEMLVWNGVALAVLGFVQLVMGAEGPLWSTYERCGGPYFFSTFGYPNDGGDYFAILFALSMGVWRRRCDDMREYLKENPENHVSGHQIFWGKHYILIASVMLLLAALNTLSRAAIILVSTAAVVLMVHAAIVALSRMHRARRVYAIAIMGLALVALGFGVSVFAPSKIRKEMNTLDTRSILDRVSVGEYHTRVSIDLFWEHPLFGCGGWGYAHLSPLKMTEKQRAGLKWTRGAANVHNDYLQFLCEHGAVGFGCLATIVIMLLVPVAGTWRRLAKIARFTKDKEAPPSPRSIFALPSGAFATLLACCIPLAHAFGDCPFRSPAILSLFFVALAACDGYLPHLEREKEPKENE